MVEHSRWSGGSRLARATGEDRPRAGRPDPGAGGRVPDAPEASERPVPATADPSAGRSADRAAEADTVGAHPEPAHALELTQLIRRAGAGDRDASRAVLPAVYDELRRLATARLARLPVGQTLQATALVHEVWLELERGHDVAWNGRGHFFGAAAQAMRDILVDAARRKGRLKRGGDRRRLAWDDVASDLAATTDFGSWSTAEGADADPALAAERFLRLEHAVSELELQHPAHAEVVRMRWYCGLTIDATADVLDTTTRTVERRWRFARAWLHGVLADEPRSESLDRPERPERPACPERPQRPDA